MEQGTTDEDCLYLNVWVPAAKEKQLPVVVFFHGGSFSEGSGDISAYDGSAMAAKGVIVITANYRLGALGYLATREMETDSPDHTAGNFGLRDQIAVLRWIRRNATSFGGDSSAVTIMGQSAGAKSVQALLSSPDARGLFRAAIDESGITVAPNAAPYTLAVAEERGEAFMSAAGVKSLAELRALPVEEIMQAQGKAAPPRLIADGVLVPPCFAQMVNGCPLSVSLLTGWNAQEAGVLPNYGTHTVAEYAEYAQKTYGTRASAFLKLYPGSTDAEANASYLQAARDKNRLGFLLWVRTRQVSEPSRIFAYYFDRQVPWKLHPEYAAHHTGEIPYVFGNLSRVKRDYDDTDRQLSERMLEYWTNFAKTGSPNGPGLPPWDAYRAANPGTQELGERMGKMPPLSANVLQFWTDSLQRP